MLAAATAKHLTTLGLVTFDETGTGGDCFLAHMPSDPDEAVAVMPTGGLPQPANTGDDRPTLQLLVRGPRFAARPGWTRAQAIYDALACLDNVRLDAAGPDDIWVVGFTALQSAPVAIGQDDNQRHEWSLNFVVDISNPTPHRN